MTEAEWQACERPHPMLVFLRGEVPAEVKGAFGSAIISTDGDLYYGPGERVTAKQCQRFILRCATRLRELPLDEPSRQALAAYRQHVLEGASRDAFFEACQRIHGVLLAGGTALVSHLAAGFWTDDPAGASSAAMDVACTIVNVKTKGSVAVTCAAATEDDWFGWSFCGGPPDPLWQSTRAAEERWQAGVLREVVGYPLQMAKHAAPPQERDVTRTPKNK